MYTIVRRILKAFNADEQYIEQVLRELRDLGVEDIIDRGKVLLHTGVRALGKGQNSIVVTCRYHGELYACKILRPDASRRELTHEAEMLKIANTVNVGPRLVTYSRKVIIMELIEGEDIGEYVKAVQDPDRLKKVIRETLLQAYRLDEIGLEHGELARPEEHIIVGRNKICIIDFESSKYRGRKISKNVTQIVNALIVGKYKVAEIIRKMLKINTDIILSLVREYKRNPSLEIVNKMIRNLDAVEDEKGT